MIFLGRRSSCTARSWRFDISKTKDMHLLDLTIRDDQISVTIFELIPAFTSAYKELNHMFIEIDS